MSTAEQGHTLVSPSDEFIFFTPEVAEDAAGVQIGGDAERSG